MNLIARCWTSCKVRPALAVLSLISLTAAFAATGCSSHAAKGNDKDTAVSAVVKAGHPKRQSLTHVVEQPGRLEAYEQAPLFAKISGYVEKVNVDIGVKVQKGQVLAELSMPEMVKEIEQKKAGVGQAKAEIEQAEQAVKTAQASYETAESLVQEATFSAKRAQADLEFWQSESTRMDKMVRNKVINEQSGAEAVNQLKSAEASLQLGNAKIQSAKATQRESQAKWDKAKADVEATRSRLRFAEADQARMETWLEYAKIRAPFDGVVSDRHVDPGHFLQPGMSGGAVKTEPLFIVVRTDVVRVFVDVPETDAICVKNESAAVVRIQALGESEYEGKVMGSSWALDPRQRTLRTEIDLKNPEGKLRPGMYAYANITVQRPEVLTLPASAVLSRDSETFCFRVENGKTVRTPIHIGFRENGVVEVLKKQTIQSNGEKRWENFTGQETIVLKEPGNLNDGQAVTVAD